MGRLRLRFGPPEIQDKWEEEPVRPVAVVLTLLAVCLSTAVLAAPVRLVGQYPIQVVKTAKVNATGGTTVTSSVVVPLAGGGVASLNDFMQRIVPAALAANGDLPAASGAAPSVLPVKIVTKGYVVGKTHPVWLKVTACCDNGLKVHETRGEKFRGTVTDPSDWQIASYFITNYSAWARVNKLHQTKVLPKPVDVVKSYNWIDP